MVTFVTYPDGTREMHDAGLTIRVKDGVLDAATLTLRPNAPAVALDTALGDAQSVGYVWQRRVQKKWAAQAAGQTPLMTDAGPVWWPDPVTEAAGAMALP